MIYSVTGKPTFVDENTLAVSVNNISYEVFVSTNTAYEVSGKDQITLYTYLHVREDEIKLYGFLNQKEKSLFINLISVSGIGPKMAMSILSSAKLDNLAMAISSGDVKMLSTVKGLGKKTAERIILELRDKLGIETSASASIVSGPVSSNMIDAIETLVLLGINKADATSVVKSLDCTGLSAEDIVKKALTKI